ncbi:hypothetical protein ACFL0V_01695 [Nanoarchaeota archaeon]
MARLVKKTVTATEIRPMARSEAQIEMNRNLARALFLGYIRDAERYCTELVCEEAGPEYGMLYASINSYNSGNRWLSERCLELAEQIGDNQHVRLMRMHLDQLTHDHTFEGLAREVEALLDAYPEDEEIVSKADIYSHMLRPEYQAELCRRNERKKANLT